MKRPLFAAVLLSLLSIGAFARPEGGVVKGTVRFRGQPPPGKKYQVAGLLGDEAKLYPKGIVVDPVPVDAQGDIAGCIVYVRKGLEGRSFAAPQVAKNLAFDQFLLKPRMLGIMVGQELVTDSRDPFHNLHVVPWQNKETNQGLPGRGTSTRRSFTEPEVGIRLYCDVHPGWETSWITVLPHPYYAVTDEHGNFEIPGLPPGTYEVEAWQEHCIAARQTVVIKDKGELTADFSLESRPPLKNEVWYPPEDGKLYRELQDKLIEVIGEFDFLPSAFQPPPPMAQGRRCGFLASDRKKALCSLSPGEEERMKGLPAKSRLQLRGTFRGKIPSDGAQFVLEDCVVTQGLPFGK